MDSIVLRWWLDDLCLILVLGWFVDLLFGSLLGVMIVLFTPVWVECFGGLRVVNSVVRLHGRVYFNLFMVCYFGLVYSLCTLLVLVVWLSCCLAICLGWFIGWLAAWWRFVGFVCLLVLVGYLLWWFCLVYFVFTFLVGVSVGDLLLLLLLMAWFVSWVCLW